MRKIRTRVAPSPTGDPHVGTAYMALFNYCFAKKNNGEFILRIEDTDQARSTLESENKIFNSLKWLGLEWSEGPDIGGKFAPYRQSERKHIYKQYSDELLNKGLAFKCFCTPDDLESMRIHQSEQGLTQKYDGRCQHLQQKQIEDNIISNKPYVVRMKIPTDGECVVKDYLRGDVTYSWSQIDMQVLLKSDGMPTYFLANVVDDYLMEITHVIRGEEWLNSTPKTILLYDYFGWEKPIFCHMPLLRSIDGKKLSKRHNPTSITFYKDKGYTPEALLNYLGRMGWSMPNQEEKFSLSEMINNFDLSRVSIGGPVFDVNKLSWLNGVWLRDKTDDEFKEELLDWIFSNNKINQLIPLVKSRIETYDKAIDISNFIFNSDVTINVVDFEKIGLPFSLSVLEEIVSQFDEIKNWNKDSILTTLKNVAQVKNVKFKEIMPIVFLVITGSLNSFSVIDSMEIIGVDLTRYRFRRALSILKKVE